MSQVFCFTAQPNVNNQCADRHKKTQCMHVVEVRLGQMEIIAFTPFVRQKENRLAVGMLQLQFQHSIKLLGT